MSNPQHRGCTTSIRSPVCWSRNKRAGGALVNQNLLCVLPTSTAQHPTVPTRTPCQTLKRTLRHQEECGHCAPARPRQLAYPATPHFHVRWSATPVNNSKEKQVTREDRDMEGNSGEKRRQ